MIMVMLPVTKHDNGDGGDDDVVDDDDDDDDVDGDGVIVAMTIFLHY